MITPITFLFSLLPLPIYADGQFSRDYKPFKAFFITQKGLAREDALTLQNAFDYVNDKLSAILKGPTLKEVRFERQIMQDSKCSNPECEGTRIPWDYAMPCVLPNGTVVKESKVITSQVQNASYSLSIYVALYDANSNSEQPAFDSNCEYFVDQNRKRPSCRWYGPAATGKVCQKDINGRPSHGIIIFCKPLIKFAIDQGELRMVLLHEVLHFLVQYMNSDSTSLLRSWRSETGEPIDQTFYLVTSPRIRAFVRNYFNCDKLPGAEVPVRIFKNVTPVFLKPKWDHWSFRLYPDEILAPHTSYDEVLSGLTLGAIADRGWYEVDTSKAGSLPKLQPDANGCDLASKSCYELIQEARQKSDALFDIWPICDRETSLSTRCSLDGKRRMLCHQIEGYGCYTLHSVACQEHHPLCSEATRQSDLYPTIGFQRGDQSICVTIVSFPGLIRANLTTEYSMPPCIESECLEKEETILLKFNAPSADDCEFACTKHQSNRLVEYVPNEKCRLALDPYNSNTKIQLICPDYHAICKNVPTSGSDKEKAIIIFTVILSVVSFW